MNKTLPNHFNFTLNSWNKNLNQDFLEIQTSMHLQCLRILDEKMALFLNIVKPNCINEALVEIKILSSESI